MEVLEDGVIVFGMMTFLLWRIFISFLSIFLKFLVDI